MGKGTGKGKGKGKDNATMSGKITLVSGGLTVLFGLIALILSGVLIPLNFDKDALTKCGNDEKAFGRDCKSAGYRRMLADPPAAWHLLLDGPSALIDAADTTAHRIHATAHTLKAHADPTANFLKDVVHADTKKTPRKLAGRMLVQQQCKDAIGTCPYGWSKNPSADDDACLGSVCDISGSDRFICCSLGSSSDPSSNPSSNPSSYPSSYPSSNPSSNPSSDQYAAASCGQVQKDMCDGMDSSSTDLKSVIGLVSNVAMASAGLAILGVVPSIVGAVAKIMGNEQLENICGGMAILTTFCCGFLLSVALAGGVFVLGGAIGVACDEVKAELDNYESDTPGCGENCFKAVEAQVKGFCDVGSGMSTSAIICFVTSTFGLLTAVYTCIGFCQKKKQVQPANNNTVVVVQPQEQPGVQMATPVEDDKGQTA